jgi:hypothetical protein
MNGGCGALKPLKDHPGGIGQCNLQSFTMSKFEKSGPGTFHGALPHVVRPRTWMSRRAVGKCKAKHIEDFSFGVAPLALLLLPVLITALACNVILALATSLLSFSSLMLFVAPASPTRLRPTRRFHH